MAERHEMEENRVAERHASSLEHAVRPLNHQTSGSELPLQVPEARRLVAEAQGAERASIPEHLIQPKSDQVDRPKELLDNDLEKLRVQTQWLRGRGEWPVAVVPADLPTSNTASGYFTQAKHIEGKTPRQIESLLGLQVGEFSRGAIVQEFRTIPRQDQFESAGHGGHVWKLNPDVRLRARVIGEVQPDKPCKLDLEIQACGAVALDRVSHFVSPELNLTPITSAEHEMLHYSADSSDAMSKILGRQGEHIAHTIQPVSAEEGQMRTQYGLHFQGDLNEVVAQMQYEGWGKAKLLNDKDTGHDNHPHTDLAFQSEGKKLSFEADMKVSLRQDPHRYYMGKLAKFDTLVENGELTPDKAHLFVPHDHVVPLKNAIDARFEYDTAQAEVWKSCVHESGLSSEHYRLIIDHCTDATVPNRVSLDRINDLADDLQTASIYLKTL